MKIFVFKVSKAREARQKKIFDPFDPTKKSTGQRPLYRKLPNIRGGPKIFLFTFFCRESQISDGCCKTLNDSKPWGSVSRVLFPATAQGQTPMGQTLGRNFAAPLMYGNLRYAVHYTIAFSSTAPSVRFFQGKHQVCPPYENARCASLLSHKAGSELVF